VQGNVAKAFIWISSRPTLELTAAAIHGTGGGSALGMARGEKGGAPFMGGQGACKRPQGTHGDI
jgi:hypothetical protein